MKIFYTVIVAAIGFVCILISDFLLQKVSPKSWFGKMVSKNGVRMAISYLIGIAVLLVGARVFSIMSF